MHGAVKVLPAVYLNIQPRLWQAWAGRLQDQAEIKGPIVPLQCFHLGYDVPHAWQAAQLRICCGCIVGWRMPALGQAAGWVAVGAVHPAASLVGALHGHLSTVLAAAAAPSISAAVVGANARRPVTASYIFGPIIDRNLPPFLHLQNKKGGEAKAITAQEAAAEAEAIRRAAWALYKGDPAAWGNALRFSWDNVSSHVSAQPDVSLLPVQWVEVPARSPDLHNVIERPHHLIQKGFKKELAHRPQIKTTAAAIKLLREVVKKKISKGYIQALVDAMPKTYASVIANGGDWADKPYR